MKKIMFNDRFNLTKLVLEGRKNMTRRFINSDYSSIIVSEGKYLGVVGNEEEYIRIVPKYEVGEIVAIAQPYKMVYQDDWKALLGHYPNLAEREDAECLAGWNNKLFVQADLMINHIRITNIKVDRLQNISEKDSLNEGITRTIHKSADGEWARYYWYHGVTKTNCPHGQYKEYDTATEAFANLINEIGGKGTWERNPFVMVYEFELVK